MAFHYDLARIQTESPTTNATFANGGCSFTALHAPFSYLVASLHNFGLHFFGLHFFGLRFVVIRFVVLRFVVLCFVVLCFVVIRFVVLCFVVLCFFRHYTLAGHKIELFAKNKREPKLFHKNIKDNQAINYNQKNDRRNHQIVDENAFVQGFN